jgi:hypothetical protein
MVLDQYLPACHPLGLAQQLGLVGGVVQHVDEDDDFERIVGERQGATIEQLDRDERLTAGDHIETREVQLRTDLHDLAGQEAIAAPDVENAHCARQESTGQHIRQSVDAALMNVPEVEVVQPRHRPPLRPGDGIRGHERTIGISRTPTPGSRASVRPLFSTRTASRSGPFR